MNKNQTTKYKKTMLAVLLSIMCLFCETTAPLVSVVHADETTEDGSISSVSLDYVSDVTMHTAGSTLRLYGSPDQTYQVPIRVTADSTLILDHIRNEADITVADGIHARILLRGNSSCNNILAIGGTQTTVTIAGDSADAMLTAGRIACSSGGTTQTGAKVHIEACTVICQDLGCGTIGRDSAYNGGSATIASATPGSNASPEITITSAQIMVSGSLACGGNGVSSQGTWSATASNGGTAGSVWIDNSRVSVGGNIAMGGRGGDGRIGSSYYDHASGITQSACPVQIINHSYVTVTGNVATQQNLPQISRDGKQQGLHGVQVEISDSTLIAKDIASGGNGHQLIRSASSSGAGTSYDVAGIAGGNGGTIIAKNAVIECNTAVCGANAGDYMNYQVSMYGNYSGDYESVNHPLDGNGGHIDSDQCEWTIHSSAGEKGSRWNGYANASTYADQRFIGGVLNGYVHGAVITTDLTSILEGDFKATVDIRNSEEAACSKCLLKTDETLGSTVVTVTANELTGSSRLDESGQMHTYIGIGRQRIRLLGIRPFEASVRVKRSAALNEFQLNAYGRLNMSYGDAVIREDSYHYLDEDYEYTGDYTVSGTGDHTLTIESGEHVLSFDETRLDTLDVQGTSIVRLRLMVPVHIRRILISENALLLIEGANLLSYESCQGSLRNGEGKRLFPVSLIIETPDQYQLTLNGDEKLLAADDLPDDGELHFLLPEGDCQIKLCKEPFVFTGEWQIHQPQQIYQSDLRLLLDCSRSDILIEEEQVIFDGNTIATQADVCLTQSGALQPVDVKKKDAMLWLNQIAPNIQIYVTRDFCGEIRDCSGIPLRLVTISTGRAEYPVQFELDGSRYDVVTNKDGIFTFLATIGTHDFRFIIDDQSYWITGNLHVSADDNKNFYEEADLTDQEPEVNPDPQPDTNPDLQPDSKSDQISDEPETPKTEPEVPTDSTGSDNAGSDSGSTSSGSGSNGSSSGGYSSGSYSSGGYSSSSSSSGSSSSGSYGSTTSSGTSTAASIQIKQDGIRLLDPGETSDQIFYTKKDVTFQISVPDGATCDYRIIRQDEAVSTQWKRLDTDQLTIHENQQDGRAEAVIFRTTDRHTVTQQQTNYFCIDREHPVIRGVKHLRFYKKARHIRIRDNCKLRDIRLNGRKMKSSFTLKKRGVYFLKATDRAGNSRLCVFAIL